MRYIKLEYDSGQFYLICGIGRFDDKDIETKGQPLPGDKDFLRRLIELYQDEGVRDIRNGNLRKNIFDYVTGKTDK